MDYPSAVAETEAELPTQTLGVGPAFVIELEAFSGPLGRDRKSVV